MARYRVSVVITYDDAPDEELFDLTTTSPEIAASTLRAAADSIKPITPVHKWSPGVRGGSMTDSPGSTGIVINKP